MPYNIHSDLLLQSPIPIVVLSDSLAIELVNDAFLQLSGFSKSELLGAEPPFPWWNLGDKEAPFPTKEEIRRFYNEGIKRLERNYLDKNGSPFCVELSVSPVQGECGIKCYLMSMVNVSYRKGKNGPTCQDEDLMARTEALEQAYAALQQEVAEKAEWEQRLEREVASRTEELNKSKSFWEQLFQESPEGIAFLDGEDRIIQVNKAFCSMFGYDSQEAKGSPINSLVGRSPTVQLDAERLTRKLFGGGDSFVHDTYRTRFDGTLIPVSVHASPFNFGGQTFAYCGYRDISERIKIEDRLKYHSNLQNLLARVSYRFVFPSSELDSLIIQSLGDFGRFFQADLCRLFQVDQDGKIVRSLGWRDKGLMPEFESLKANFSVEDIPWLWGRLQEDDVVMVEGIDSLPSHARIEKQYLSLSNSETFLFYPLFLRGTLSGVIVLGRPAKARDISEGTSDFYVFSSIISAALERHEGEKSLKANYLTIQDTFESSIKTMGEMLAARDPYTAKHQKNVSKLSDLIAARLGMSDELRKGLKISALVHDIGKIRVPAEILNKPGFLSSLEFDMIKEHPQIGKEILSNIHFPWPVSTIVAQHHERIDGSGYPEKLLGGDILPQAKVLAVADVVEAMTSHRPYRPGLGLDAALDEIRRGQGTLYDPASVDACLGLLKDRESLEFLDG